MKLNDVFPFGKYKGKTVKFVISDWKEVNYMNWWNTNIKDYPLSEEVKVEMKRIQKMLDDHIGAGGYDSNDFEMDEFVTLNRF